MSTPTDRPTPQIRYQIYYSVRENCLISQLPLTLATQFPCTPCFRTTLFIHLLQSPLYPIITSHLIICFAHSMQISELIIICRDMKRNPSYSQDSGSLIHGNCCLLYHPVVVRYKTAHKVLNFHYSYFSFSCSYYNFVIQGSSLMTKP